MNDKIKNVVVTILFLFVIITILISNIINKDKEVSIAERRKLEQFPKFSLYELFKGNFIKKFDNYTMDQFIQRESFRKLKTIIEIDILKKQDSNNIYEYENKLIEQIYPLNEKSVVNITKKMDEINKTYLNETNKIYYTIIPDKNYFGDDKHLKLNYNKLQDIMKENLDWAEYINIFDCLDLSCYYATDSHWKQEKLPKVANRIATKMKFKLKAEYEEKKVVDFKGVYVGQFLKEIGMDEIHILNNEIIENSKVYNYETNKITKVYDMEKINARDKYDIYLSGAASLLTIENNKGNKNKELIVFRDSYGSSLVPLLIEEYYKITIIDTRYISPKILNQYVDFKNKEILFMYSTMLINNSKSLK